MEYIIVKYADDNYWQGTFQEDPRINGLPRDCSAANDYTGKHVGIKHTYTDLVEAKRDCQRMNEANPCVGYAVINVND